MPKKMASDPAALHAFWYKQNVSPPKDYALWDAMIIAFTQRDRTLCHRRRVSKWRFEVWNEPNLDFWVGNPKQPTYFELYDHTALAIKKVNPRLLIGGPSTAQAAWVAAFLEHCKQNNIPVDFVSTHVYANDTAKDVMGTNEQIPRDRMVCRAVSEGPRRDRRISISQRTPHLQQVFTTPVTPTRTRRHRQCLHGPVARRHHQSVRQPPCRGNELLDLLRCLRGAGRHQNSAFTAASTLSPKTEYPNLPSTPSPCCTSSAIGASRQTRTPHWRRDAATARSQSHFGTTLLPSGTGAAPHPAPCKHRPIRDIHRKTRRRPPECPRSNLAPRRRPRKRHQTI